MHPNRPGSNARLNWALLSVGRRESLALSDKKQDTTAAEAPEVIKVVEAQLLTALQTGSWRHSAMPEGSNFG